MAFPAESFFVGENELEAISSLSCNTVIAGTQLQQLYRMHTHQELVGTWELSLTLYAADSPC